jgi:hypothetical protein
LDVARQLGVPARSSRPVILISTPSERDLAELIDASPAIGSLPKSELSGRAIRELVTRTGETWHSGGV